MKFLDQVIIYVQAGNGGNGSISFRREKYIEFGGPDGGNGGCGGNIYIKSVSELNTLIDYSYKRYFIAQNGMNGMGKNKTGRNGKDIILKVPIGTQIFSKDKKTMIFDFTKSGQSFIVANGGKGGFGNLHFTTSKNRAPKYANPGLKGENLFLFLQLKLIADIGIVGLPNSGKSTFLSSITSAKPKIADYFFTTLYPNLGVVFMNNKSFIFADIPGLIEGAHYGHGLGDKFLGHIERTNSLLHLISACESNPVKSYKIVRKELELYNAGQIAKKQEIIALSKIDLIDEKELYKKVKSLQKVTNSDIIFFSSVKKIYLKESLRIIIEKLEKNMFFNFN